MENLDNNQLNEAKEILAKLQNLYNEKIKHEILAKEREDNLKLEFASALNLNDKEGNADIKRVKMPLVSALLDELYRDKPNKKQAEYELMQDYKNAMQKEINKEVLNNYEAAVQAIAESQSGIKEVFKDSTLLSKEALSALDFIAKESYKLEKVKEFEKAGFEQKEPKDNAEVLELVEFLKVKLGL